eukprot:6400530-Amphidinium_carterae.1
MWIVDCRPFLAQVNVKLYVKPSADMNTAFDLHVSAVDTVAMVKDSQRRPASTPILVQVKKLQCSSASMSN